MNSGSPSSPRTETIGPSRWRRRARLAARDGRLEEVLPSPLLPSKLEAHTNEPTPPSITEYSEKQRIPIKTSCLGDYVYSSS